MARRRVFKRDALGRFAASTLSGAVAGSVVDDSILGLTAGGVAGGCQLYRPGQSRTADYAPFCGFGGPEGKAYPRDRFKVARNTTDTPQEG